MTEKYDWRKDKVGIRPSTYLLLLIAFCVLWVVAKCARNMHWGWQDYY